MNDKFSKILKSIDQSINALIFSFCSQEIFMENTDIESPDTLLKNKQVNNTTLLVNIIYCTDLIV
jgi:hypothetical protein